MAGVRQPIITARKRSLRRLCFHRCLSVHRGVPAQVPPSQVPTWQVHPLVGTAPSRHNPQVGTPPTPQQVHPQASTPLLAGTPRQVHPPSRHTPPRQVPPWQVHPPTGTFPWAVPPKAGTPPDHSACWDTVNKRAVRIPLECILD